jgi:hypothetical protein
VGHNERSARVVLAAFAAMAAAPLAAGPLAWGPASPGRLGQPCAVASPSTSDVDLSLVWVDVTGASRFAFPGASRELVALLARMGVKATVRLADARSVSTERELTLILLPRQPAGTRLHHAVMGATQRAEAPVRAIWVYTGGVGATLGLSWPPAPRWSLFQRRDFALALGRVVAHEVVHAVAPGQPHVEGGLMARSMGRPLLLAKHLEIAPAITHAFRAALGGTRPGSDGTLELARLPAQKGGE